MSETRFLFIRNNGCWSNSIDVSIEDYIRNVRLPDLPNGKYSEEIWETPINYRFPYLTQEHEYKLVRNLNVSDNLPPQLSI